MAIKINQDEGFFKISGEMTSENALMLKKHFENFTRQIDDIIVSLDDVSYMEEGGAFTLEQLYLDFIKNKRVIQIIGRENKNIAGVMKGTKTSYILSNDRY